jgi:multisubunit Na+/H+ antiporter MnhC subunit
MRRLREALDRLPRERLAELVSAGCYGTVLVLAALGVVGVSDIALGHGSELVAGVGLATWVAHIFAELVGGHARRPEPLRRSEVLRALADGSPILAATVLPAIVLGFGRLDLVSDATARVAAIVVAVLQLLGIGAFVARVAPAPPAARWTFAAATAGIGIAVVALTVLLGH